MQRKSSFTPFCSVFTLYETFYINTIVFLIFIIVLMYAGVYLKSLLNKSSCFPSYSSLIESGMLSEMPDIA